MDTGILHAFPDLYQEQLQLFLRPAQTPCKYRHAESRQAIAEVFVHPQAYVPPHQLTNQENTIQKTKQKSIQRTQFFHLWILRPSVLRPSVLHLDDILKANLLEPFLVIFRAGCGLA